MNFNGEDTSNLRLKKELLKLPGKTPLRLKMRFSQAHSKILN
jgi:hypothetical protein